MIGYYVHHHGSGHRQRALAIAAHLGADITLLGSLGPASGVPGAYVELPRDDTPRPDPRSDVTAGGSLHWAPLQHEGLRARHAMLARWLSTTPARLLVSDVSVEAVLLARLLSVPPVVVAQRGIRDDRAHAAGYDAAVRIVAPWTRTTQHPWPSQWLAKTTWVGLVSRFDGRSRVPARCDLAGTCVVLLLGQGGHGLSPAHLAEVAAVDGVHWHVLGDPPALPDLAPGDAERLVLHGHVDDPWGQLCRADVVVSAAGGSAIADVAAARAPLIAVPQARPFDEQNHQVRVLARQGLCVGVDPWPTRAAWPALLEQARAWGGAGWAELSDGGGARRAAAVLAELANRRWSGAASA